MIALTLGVFCLALCVNWARGQEPTRGVAFLVEAQASEDAEGVTVNTAGAVVLHRSGVEYPERLREKGVQGTLSVEVTLDSGGQVMDAHVLSGPNELRKAVLTSVLDWHFAPGGGNTRIIQICIPGGGRPFITRG